MFSQFLLALSTFSLPTTTLAQNDYSLNPGDRLEISVWEEEQLMRKVIISPDGTISFPLIGNIIAAGHTTVELVNSLHRRITKFIPNAEINVRLIAPEGNTVYVIGEVEKPGEIMMKGPLRVIQALSIAGGLTVYAKKDDIIILRREADGKNKSLLFDYGEIEDGENIGSNILLKAGDTIIVP